MDELTSYLLHEKCRGVDTQTSGIIHTRFWASSMFLIYDFLQKHQGFTKVWAALSLMAPYPTCLIVLLMVDDRGNGLQGKHPLPGFLGKG